MGPTPVFEGLSLAVGFVPTSSGPLVLGNTLLLGAVCVGLDVVAGALVVEVGTEDELVPGGVELGVDGVLAVAPVDGPSGAPELIDEVTLVPSDPGVGSSEAWQPALNNTHHANPTFEELKRTKTSGMDTIGLDASKLPFG